MRTPQNNGEMAQYGDDRSLLVEFYLEPVHQEFASKSAGRPIYKDEAFIHINMPGGKSDLRRRVRMEEGNGAPSDPDRFPRQWAAFKNQQEQVSEGTPIAEFPPLSKSQVMEFKAQKIHTVEQLAAFPDSALQNLGLDGRKYRDMAAAFLDKAKGMAQYTEMQARNSVLEADLKALKEQFAEMAASQPKRGPGRTPKGDHNAED
jgi:hypothetical protein